MTQSVAAWAQIYHDPTNAFLKIDFVFFMQHDKTDEFSALDAADTKAGLLKTTRLLG